jgi:hypothetical protein
MIESLGSTSKQGPEASCGRPTPFGNYLHAHHFFDEAFAEFTSSLARAGLLEDTMLVVFGDHDAGFQRESLSARTLGIGHDAASWEINDRVPLFVKLPERGSDVPHGSLSLVAGQTDLHRRFWDCSGSTPGRFCMWVGTGWDAPTMCRFRDHLATG